VVDTGLHAYGWTRARAVAYMLANTALTPANVDAEVNATVTWPGQATAYKVGELRIRALRERAERALGARFDLRAFHDAVLELGPVPLDVLEAHVARGSSRSSGRGDGRWRGPDARGADARGRGRAGGPGARRGPPPASSRARRRIRSAATRGGTRGPSARAGRPGPAYAPSAPSRRSG
jgi:hypothetical protein